MKIKHISGQVLYSSDRHSDLRSLVEDAVVNGAALRGASLRGANLQYVILQGANLPGAAFCGADIRGPGLIDAGQSSRGYRHFAVKDPNAEGGYTVKAGCHHFSMARAREYWSKTYQGSADIDEINAKLDYIETMVKNFGWDKG